ncbi:MAG TPA: GDSL-type esterase/lipase family protein [Thermoanaerobaculia bacterium]|nr:GDSL-type esterase/lipase family protein [Thermoanaerobaculia bacterium]
MRRFLFWHLPITTALIAAAVFAYGFVAYLRGDTGTPVDFLPARAESVPAPQQQTLAPLILGDSLARGAGDETGLGIPGRLDQELRRRNLRAQRTLNLGINGARTRDLLQQMERPNVQLLVRQANVIVVSIGGNDLWGGADWRTAAPPDPDAAMDDVLRRIETIVARIRALNPRARIFLIGLYNPFTGSPYGKQIAMFVSRWNARVLQRFATDPELTLVHTADLFSHRDRLALDRFHPSSEGYGLIARRIADAL